MSEDSSTNFMIAAIWEGHTKRQKDTKRHEKTREDTKRHEKTHEKTRKDTNDTPRDIIQCE